MQCNICSEHILGDVKPLFKNCPRCTFLVILNMFFTTVRGPFLMMLKLFFYNCPGPIFDDVKAVFLQLSGGLFFVLVKRPISVLAADL